MKPACRSLNGFPCYRLPSGCICLISTQKPWVDAFNYCSANGRKLVSIQNVAKQLEIKTYLSSVIGSSIKINYFASLFYMLIYLYVVCLYTEKDDIFEFVGFWTVSINNVKYLFYLFLFIFTGIFWTVWNLRIDNIHMGEHS